MITRRARDQRLIRVYRGVYAVGHSALSQEARWLAAVLAAGDAAQRPAAGDRRSGRGREICALSHAGAARLWRIWPREYYVPSRPIDVVTNVRRRHLADACVHESRSLRARDVTRRERVPVTTVARTLLDLASMLDAHQLANVMHEAAFRRRLNVRAVREVLQRNRGRAAVTVLARALQLHLSGSAGTRSALEDAYLAHVREFGATEPTVNTTLAVDGGEVEVDFLWPSHRLCVEVDGAGHDRPRTRREDAARDARLRRAGYRVMRCTSADLREHARVVAGIVSTH